MESLQGNFLVATNQMHDPRFVRSVVFICHHDHDDGAMGLIVNQPLLDLSMVDVFKMFELEIAGLSLPPVYFGGPVDVESAFILHSADYISDKSQQLLGKICLSRDPHFLVDVANGKGPRHYLFALGYAGWGPGQLEQELCGEGWLTLPAEADDLFGLPAASMWKKVSEKYGIDINLFTDIAGNA